MLVLIAAAVLSVVSAESVKYAPPPYKPSYGPAKPVYAPHQPYHEPAKPYGFEYAVNDHYTGAVFSQQESSDAKDVTGSYSVALPDGRVQTVTYTADNEGYGGYNAQVTYEGEAYHPEPYGPKPAPAPYKPAPAPYKPAPAPYKPTPAPYKPAPATYKPAPKPAPAPYTPVYETSKPAYVPLPPAYKPKYEPYKPAKHSVRNYDVSSK